MQTPSAVAVVGMVACAPDVGTSGSLHTLPVEVGGWERWHLDRAQLCGPEQPWTIEGDIFALPAPRPLPEAPPPDAIRAPSAAQEEAMQLLLGTTADGHFRRERVERVVRALELVRAESRAAAEARVVLRHSLVKLLVAFSAPPAGTPRTRPSRPVPDLAVDVDHSGMEALDALGRSYGVAQLSLDAPMRSLEVRFAQPVDTVVAGWSYAALPGVMHAAPSTTIGVSRGMELVDRDGLFHLTVYRPGDPTMWMSGDSPAVWFVVDTDSWALQELEFTPGSAPGHGAVLPFDLQPQAQVLPYGDLDELLLRTGSPVWWEALHAVATVRALGCGPVDALASVDRDDQTFEASEHFRDVRDALLERRSEAALALVDALEHDDAAVRRQAWEGLRWWSRAPWDREDVDRWDAWASQEGHW